MSPPPSAPPPGKRPRVATIFGLLVALRIVLRRPWRQSASPAPVEESAADPSEREVPANRRVETVVAALLGVAALFALGFTAVYVVAGSDTQLLGLAIAAALACLSAAAIVAGKMVVPQETAVEERNRMLVPEEAHEVLDIVRSGAQGISRRKLLAGAAGTAGAALLTAAATPLASLGPDLDHISQSPWRAGMRLVDDEGRPYHAADIEIGSFYTALPEGADPEDLGSALLVVKLPAEWIHLPPARAHWAPRGILAYSKICPHAACAISLYRYPLYAPTSTDIPAFTCPCHYSTFAPGEGGRLIFGPAGRALPQLPLTIDSQDFVRAAGPFHEGIGPSWWHVQRSES